MNCSMWGVDRWSFSSPDGGRRPLRRSCEADSAQIDRSASRGTRYWLSESDLAYLLDRLATDGIQRLKAKHVANAAGKS